MSKFKTMADLGKEQYPLVQGKLIKLTKRLNGLGFETRNEYFESEFTYNRIVNLVKDPRFNIYLDRNKSCLAIFETANCFQNINNQWINFIKEVWDCICEYNDSIKM